MDPADLLCAIPKSTLNGEIIEALYSPNGYLIKRIYRDNPSESNDWNRTDIQEFWNGGGGLSDYLRTKANWARLWIKGGREKFRLITEGNTRPGGL